MTEAVGVKGSWNLWLNDSHRSCSHLLGGAVLEVGFLQAEYSLGFFGKVVAHVPASLPSRGAASGRSASARSLCLPGQW